MSSKIERPRGQLSWLLDIPRRMTSAISGLFCCFLLNRLANNLECGGIHFILPGQKEIKFKTAKKGPNAIIKFRSYTGILRLCFGGYMGLGEGYVNGDWSTPSLKELFQFGIENQEKFRTRLSGNYLARIPRKIFRILNRNSKKGSKRNISYHYDLGNEFYKLWLDSSMTYSSGFYEDPGLSLEEAQLKKYRRIIETLGIRSNHHVLEIGCGWGGFSELVAEETGATITGITISKEQFDYACNRIQKAGLNKKAKIQLSDYREVSGTYDRIVSIEMLEAVGEAYWPDFFNTIAKNLAPNGKAIVQVIFVPDKRFANYRRKSDFIQRHIFPGGMLISPKMMEKQAQKVGLSISECFSFGSSYGTTLNRWHDRFIDNWGLIEALGFDGRFKRLWEYYLNYTAAGFQAGTINVGQFLLQKNIES